MEPRPEPAADGQRLVRLGLGQEQLLHLRQPIGLLVGEVVGLGEVFGQVVQLPHVLVRVPSLQSRGGARRIPRNERPEGAGEPAVVVDAAAGVVLEVLRLLPAGAWASAKV